MSDEMVGQGSAEDASVVYDGQVVQNDRTDAELQEAAIEARIAKLEGHLEVAETALAQLRANDGRE